MKYQKQLPEGNLVQFTACSKYNPAGTFLMGDTEQRRTALLTIYTQLFLEELQAKQLKTT